MHNTIEATEYNTIKTTNRAIQDKVLACLHEPQQRWLSDAKAKFAVKQSFVVQYTCDSDADGWQQESNLSQWVYEITFEDEAIAVQFKLTYGDLL